MLLVPIGFGMLLSNIPLTGILMSFRGIGGSLTIFIIWDEWEFLRLSCTLWGSVR